MKQSTSYRPGALLLLLSAAAGFLLSLYVYLAPLTGVTGTVGALLAMVVSIVIVAMAVILMRIVGRGSRITWRVLILIALAGNCFAGALLHEWWLCLAMVVGFIGYLIDFSAPSHAKKAVNS